MAATWRSSPFPGVVGIALRSNPLVLISVVVALWCFLDLDLGQFAVVALMNAFVFVVALCCLDLGQFVFVALSPFLIRVPPAICGIDLGHVDCLLLLKSEGCGSTDKKDCC